VDNRDHALTSDRLVFRTLRSDDHVVVYRQFSDSDMCTFFSDPPCTSDEAADIITHYGSPDASKRYARWGMYLRTDGSFVGTCGYHFLDRDKAQVEIGYDVWKEYWRMGFATEAVKALSGMLFAVFPVNTIYALIDPANVASIAAARNIGFTESPLLRETSDGPFLCMALRKPN
jgi:ribosomal-protein-alanine N-acetyltransferase